jgi:hypothetical protein
MMSKSLIQVGGKQVALPSLDGIVNDKGALVGARHYLAGKAGITLPKTPKGEKGASMKEVKAEIVALGHTADEIKTWSKEYDKGRAEFYRQCGQLNGMLAADPLYRKSLKVSRNAKGDVIGATTTYRRERAASTSTVAALVAQVADLTARLAATQPVALG